MTTDAQNAQRAAESRKPTWPWAARMSRRHLAQHSPRSWHCQESTAGIAVATPRLDLEDVVYELGRPGRSKLDAHHCCLPVLPWACVSNCLQWSWLLLAIFGNVACLLTYKALPVLYLDFGLSAFGCRMALPVAVDARDVLAVPWRWRSKTGRWTSPWRTIAWHKLAWASLPASGWPEASLAHHG